MVDIPDVCAFICNWMKIKLLKKGEGKGKQWIRRYFLFFCLQCTRMRRWQGDSIV
jgi:hypothetical protein